MNESMVENDKKNTTRIGFSHLLNTFDSSSLEVFVPLEFVESAIHCTNTALIQRRF